MAETRKSLNWLAELGGAGDLASAGRIAIDGIRQYFSADEVAIQLEKERWGGLAYSSSPTLDPMLQSVMQSVLEGVPAWDQVTRGAAWAMTFSDGVVGMFLPDGASLPSETDVNLLLQPVITRMEQIDFADGMRRIDESINRLLRLDELVENMLDEAVDGLGFQFVALALVDCKQREIRMRNTRNVSPGWRTASRYKLTSSDILADVIRTRKTETISGNDVRFDQKTYKKYGHESLIRVWTPLVVATTEGESAIGVLEGGCSIADQHNIMTSDNVRAFEALASENSSIIQRLVEGDTFLEAGVCGIRRALGAQAVAAGVWRHSLRIQEATDESNAPYDPSVLLNACRRQINTDGGLNEWRLEAHWIEGHLREAANAGVQTLYLFRLPLGNDATGFVAAFLTAKDAAGRIHQARAYVKRLESAMAGNLWRGSLRESLERSQNLTSLQASVHASATTGKREGALDMICQKALFLLEADNVRIYEYFGGERRFGSLAASRGEFAKASELGTTYPRTIVEHLLTSEDHRYVTDVRLEPALFRPNAVPSSFVIREGIKSTAVLLLKAGNPPEQVGLMFLNYTKRQRFSGSYQKEVEALAQSAAFALGSARYAEQQAATLTRRDEELEALRELDQRILLQIQAVDMNSIYASVMDSLMKLTKASIGCILLLNEDGKTLRFQAEQGYNLRADTTQSKNAGIVGQAIRDKQPRIVSDIPSYIEEQPGVYVELVKGMASELVVPIIDRNEVVGAINLEHKNLGAFSGPDVRIAGLLASRLVFGLHSVDLYRQLRKQISPRRTLGVIATRVQNAHYDLDSVLRLLLTGITAAEGLGFSRAMLFVVQRDIGRLKGRLAVGALTREEACTNWEALKLVVRGDFDERLRTLLGEVDRASAAIKTGVREAPLSESIQLADWSLDSLQGSLRDALHSPGVIVVKAGEDYHLRGNLTAITGDPAKNFTSLVIPLVVQGVTTGVLVVDNRFLGDAAETEIPAREDLHTLEAFAELAAMSIENAELRERLQTEAHEELTHQIKSPISLARVRLQHLEKLLPGNEQVRIVAALLEKSRRVATSVRLFASLSLGRDLRANFGVAACVNLLEWVTDVIQDYTVLEPNLEFYSYLNDADAAARIDADQFLIDQVIANLLDNALKYRYKNSTVRVELRVEERAFSVTVMNQCPNISETEIRTFPRRGTRGSVARSTKTGSGLGLWIVDHIVSAHRGRLLLESPGDAFRATVFFPLMPSGGKR